MVGQGSGSAGELNSNRSRRANPSTSSPAGLAELGSASGCGVLGAGVSADAASESRSGTTAPFSGVSPASARSAAASTFARRARASARRSSQFDACRSAPMLGKEASRPFSSFLG